MYGEKQTVQHPGITRRRCNWIGFCDWIYFFCQSFLSNAVALASLFFLFSVGFLINAIEVIFLLAWLSSLTKGTLWKRSPALSLSLYLSPSLCLSPLSLSLSIPFSFSYCPTVRGPRCFFHDTFSHVTVSYRQGNLLQSEVCQFLTSWTSCELWRRVFFLIFPKKLRPRKTGSGYGRLTI